ncbi:MAG TPA: ethanolamine ammonia-lyase reactivating factor EutA, partial [Pirellulales bacterium]|nr:ethanolamine ammonia-lyase reactivating factor EutA [Pirellulales bacterium]
ATVLGLAIHHTELSGATLFLPDPSLLPLPELPIVGRLTQASGNEEIGAAFRLVRRHGAGGCLAIGLADGRHATVRSLADRLAAELTACEFPAERPLVLLVNTNVGKALGNYVTRWGRLNVTVLVLDELPDRGASFVTLGRPKGPVVPVSFYGL